jgi:hypothetical protein
LDKGNFRKIPKMSEVYKRIVGKEFQGIIKSSESFTFITVDILPEDLFQIAQNYILSKNLNWKIENPNSWKDYPPHISLKKEMEKYSGDIVKFKIRRPYHYETEVSRWVVVECEIPSKYECDFECHLSIAQEKLNL